MLNPELLERREALLDFKDQMVDLKKLYGT